MKLVDVTEFYSQRGGGVRTHLTEKAAAAARRGHEHLVFAPGPRHATDPGVRYIPGPSLPYDPTYHLLWRVGAARRLLRAERPDVLEIHSPYVAAIAALGLQPSEFGVRTFVWHSDFIDTYLRGGLERRLTVVFRGRAPRAADRLVEPLWAHVRRIAAACAMTVVGSRWQKYKLEQHGVARVEHIPFGIEPGRFAPERRSEARRQELLAGRTGPLVLAIGRFAVEKRWDVVVDAYARLAERRPGAVLAVFGDGPERHVFQDRLGARDDVRVLGFERDRDLLAVTLASGDLLLHGCPYETFGLGVAEAIASGLPVVVPDAGGAAEQAPPESAVQYPAGDVAACVAAAEALLAVHPAELRARAAVAARRVPSVVDHFDALFGRYRELLAR
ncbi:alpha-1,6-mannosyltransferase [Nannocystis exedens]|uniref:Alpha-1,6-mannosyltransferase n=1 Tax=Nannocystis exedens TaxID=54 RepID=A0A1I1X3F4_9BACT|nr:glycosyltransferase [Nannocystis exedens]PCC70834.1 GDP-mannose-dependent alpha-(1-6)-phosphatidylinositol dimannoside mannosyltransferase [Nannocystis exedens]SFE01761.1 alpha-1,6-mannosyltransferase [Nannocystis exedens]